MKAQEFTVYRFPLAPSPRDSRDLMEELGIGGYPVYLVECKKEVGPLTVELWPVGAFDLGGALADIRPRIRTYGLVLGTGRHLLLLALQQPELAVKARIFCPDECGEDAGYAGHDVPVLEAYPSLGKDFRERLTIDNTTVSAYSEFCVGCDRHKPGYLLTVRP